jgi:hypothetical protein
MVSKTQHLNPRKKKFKLDYFRHPFARTFSLRRIAQGDCNKIRGVVRQ